MLSTMAAANGLKELFAQVTDHFTQFTSKLDELSLEPSHYDVDSPEEYHKLDPMTYMQREFIAELLQDLSWLVQGPRASTESFVNQTLSEATTLNVLNHFNFWDAVPIEGDVSLDQIAEKVNLPIEVVRRILDHALAIRYFARVDPALKASRIKHNSRSIAIARDRGLRANIATTLDSGGPPTIALSRALEKFSYGEPELPKETGSLAFNYAYSGGMLGKYDSLWDLIEGDGEGEKKGWRQKEMVALMKHTKEELKTNESLLALTDWNTPENALVVDIGGSGGHDDIPLAKKYPNLKIIVEDLPKCEPDFEASIPAELRSRLSFRAHDFFQTQPVVGADIYLFKFIFYDWPKSLAIKIIKALVPALKAGARIVVMEIIGTPLPDGVALPKAMVKAKTAADVRMMALSGNSERTAEDVENLFREADERFEFVRIDPTSKPPLLFLEMIWKGE
ncbi:O-methyltransferase lcsG [Paramyrothecium foliicola]|nr:O-methyltransferase lcsG [Paramyrothecium foliicola]